jgi:hypothetical protein
MDAPSGLWWLALTQFIICGLFTLLVFALPKFHHFPAEDRKYFLGIGITTGMLALFGLAFMAGV